jgi:hypothetical protein
VLGLIGTLLCFAVTAYAFRRLRLPLIETLFFFGLVELVEPADRARPQRR